MEVGFTGTQLGMTDVQKIELRALLKVLAPIAAHHGDCIGADAEFHYEALEARIPVIIHPPVDQTKRAFCKNATSIRPSYTYLRRNRHIVYESAVIIATPKRMSEQTRSGTWSTIRFVRKRLKPLAIIWPNGMTQYERWNLSGSR